MYKTKKKAFLMLGIFPVCFNVQLELFTKLLLLHSWVRRRAKNPRPHLSNKINIRTSVGDPRHFGADPAPDPDPRIHTSD